VGNFSGNDKTVPAVYRSCAQSYHFILLFFYLFACHRPLRSPLLFSLFSPPVVANVYIVSFRSIDDRRPSKFIVLADEIRHQGGLGTWRAGLSITLRQIHRTSTGDESGGAAGSVKHGRPLGCTFNSAGRGVPLDRR
jgi:hypothetical protein